MKTPSEQLKLDIVRAVTMCLSAQSEKSKQITKLGEFLVEKTASYPDFLEEIVLANKSIAYEWLVMVLRIGRGQTYLPLVYHYQTPGVRRIRHLEVKQQKELWEAGVVVAVPVGNGFKEKRKSICNLSHKEVFRVFGNRIVRTFAQQMEVARRLKIVPIRKYSVKDGKVFTSRCVLDKRDVLDIASKILSQNDVISLLTKVKAAA